VRTSVGRQEGYVMGHYWGGEGSSYRHSEVRRLFSDRSACAANVRVVSKTGHPLRSVVVCFLALAF
jgi:hypothetical protein